MLLTLLITSNIGAVSLTWQDLWHTDINSSQWQIWLHIRLPRLFLALIVGLALAVSGTLFQGLFHNPMADPSLIGVNSGASLAVGLSIILPSILPSQFTLHSTMVSAFIGSLTVSALIYGLELPIIWFHKQFVTVWNCCQCFVLCYSRNTNLHQ